MKNVCTVLGLALLALAASWSPAASAVDPNLHWRTLESDHFTLVYHDGEEQLAQHMLDVAEQTRTDLDPWLRWDPDQRVQLVLTDH